LSHWLAIGLRHTHATWPRDPCIHAAYHQPQVWGGMGGGESHQSGVLSHLAVNLADPAELRDTNHAPRRTASAPVLMTGA
jgi:hypothetical protein